MISFAGQRRQLLLLVGLPLTVPGLVLTATCCHSLSPQPSTPTCPLVDIFHDTPEYHVPDDEPHSTNMAAVAQMPAGATHTHLQAMKRTFNNVPVAADNAISTEEFLEAAESLTTMFGMPLFWHLSITPKLTVPTRPPRLCRLLSRQEGHVGQRRGLNADPIAPFRVFLD